MKTLALAAILALGLLTAPPAAEAQQPDKVTRVGILAPTAPVAVPRVLRQRLHELGWVEGRSFIFESRFAGDRPGRLPTLADELVRLNVDVIVAVSPPAIRAAKDATSTIPVVMAFSGVDPVRASFVASLARPGANVTGLAILAPELAVKRLEVLKEALPGADRVAVLVNPNNQSSGIKVLIQVGSVHEAQAAAATGVDGIIAQGVEAGGHVKGTTSLSALVPAVVEAVKPVPVIAAGGIGNGRGLVAALSLGAQADRWVLDF